MKFYFIFLFIFSLGCVQKSNVETVNSETEAVDRNHSSIRATNIAVADGVSTATIEIILRYSASNAAVGITPTFEALDTGATNVYETCTVSNSEGVSICRMSSTRAEEKSLTITYPITKIESSVNFIAGEASLLFSSIISSSPVFSDGVATAAITITLLDENLNPIVGELPTFSATDSGFDNIYNECTVTNSFGVATCSMTSSTTGIKRLRIEEPVVMNGGNVAFIEVFGAAVVAQSTIEELCPTNDPCPIVANGIHSSNVMITIKDVDGDPVIGEIPTFDATDTSSTNMYGVCSASNLQGLSFCTLKSTVAEVKTLRITSPVIDPGLTVTFEAGPPVGAESTITGTSNITADGVTTSTVTITLRDFYENLKSGVTPTFIATDSGSTNVYNTCSVSNASGVSTCTMTSEKAETKTLSIATPFVKVDGTVVFIAGAPSAVASTITGTGPVTADGASVSDITITIFDLYSNPVAGVTPTFTATNTGTTNTYNPCSATDSNGVATCTMSSTVSETKTLSIATPVVKSDGTVIFSPDTSDPTFSTITGTTNIVADGVSTSAITITIKDINNNPVSNITPTFTATDTGTTNVYSACTLSNASGISTCTLTSMTVETKTLSIATPFVKADGTVDFIAGAAVVANSSIVGSNNITADGVSTSTVTITLNDIYMNPLIGYTPVFSATDTGSTNTYGACSVTDNGGVSLCSLTSEKAEAKTLSLSSPIIFSDGVVTFIPGAIDTSTSTITGTGPVTSDGIATSTITITLLDAFLNPVAGNTPTFTATDTGATNSYGACSVGNASGVSTCTMTSTVSETKTLSNTTPAFAGGTVSFVPDAPDVTNSTITGTNNITADGVTTSTVTITLLDTNMNPVVGVVPTFSATDTGSTNDYNTCSATNASGVSTCTMTSEKAETKTLSIATPIVKADGTVNFIAGVVDDDTSTITGTEPTVADGVDDATITITLLDAFSNPVAGTVPTFSATDTNTTNVNSLCSASNASGVSTCTMTSEYAEDKILQIETPVVKADDTIHFKGGTPVVANSTITGTGSISANGTSTSTITITLVDVLMNPTEGYTPTFSATDTGTTNIYGTCSQSNTSGVSTCTLASTRAEVKTLQIDTPIIKADGTVTFTQVADVTNSTITGTSNITADGVTTSTITITLLDNTSTAIVGVTPTFTATNTGTTNSYGACSASNGSGVSTCTMTSTKAEVKTLSIATPIVKADGTVTFIAGAIDATTSTITGTDATADGVDTSDVTITLLDANSNPVAGTTPTFSATNTGATNAYAACSMSNASGVSTCTMTSLKAETKTLAIATPVVKSDGTVDFTAGAPSIVTSTITGTDPETADGVDTSTVTITLLDVNSNPVEGTIPTFSATDTGTTNDYNVCSSSNASGVSTCTMTSTYAETKTLSIATPIAMAGGTVDFVAGVPDGAESEILATTPVIADGVDTSDITIALYDAYENPVAGFVPTFVATDTGTTNAYSVCTMSNALGVSTCTLTSTQAEVKTVTLSSPLNIVGVTSTFVEAAQSANSTITGTSNIVADGVATSTITITLLDTNDDPIVGTTPTFSATDTGATNVYGACSVSNASGISTCTMTSTKSEVKTLSIDTPVVKPDGTVTFIGGTPVIANSTITGSGPTSADGVTASTITITLKDALLNGSSGYTPTFSATNTGSGNTYTACSASNSSGVSTCTLKSTTAETKTLTITAPVVKSDGTVVFSAGGASVANSSIVGSGPVYADGGSNSTVTITLEDSAGNPIVGTTPTFSATDTNTTNTYGACTATNVSGVSLCSLSSSEAEVKTLTLTSPINFSDGTVTFLEEGLTLQVPIEMLDRQAGSTGTATTITRSKTSLNTTDYDGTITYYLEIIATNIDASNATVNLCLTGGACNIATQTVAANTTDVTRYRTSFTPTAGNQSYSIQLSAAGNDNLIVYNARIIVEQQHATKTKIYIPLISRSTYQRTNGTTGAGAIECTTNNTYTSLTEPYLSLWRRDDAQYEDYASGSPFTFEAVINNTDAADTTSISLYNVTDGQTVTGSETTNLGTTATMVQASFASNATNFDNSDEYQVQIKSTFTSAGSGCVYKAGLWIKLDDLTKAEVLWRLSHAGTFTSDSLWEKSRVLYDSADWSTTLTYLRTVSRSSAATGETISLNDDASNDDGVGPGVVDPTSTITPTNSLSIQTSSALTLTDGNRLILSWDWTSGNIHLNTSYLVIRVEQ